MPNLAPGGHILDGYRRSPPDERDYPYSLHALALAAEDLPEEYTCPGFEDDVDDQGAVNSCVAEAIGANRDLIESKELGQRFKASRMHLYYNRDPSHWQGEGMVPREALSVLRRDGMAPEDLWPGRAEYGKAEWPMSREALAEAGRPHRIESYVRIEREFILIMKSAMVVTGPIFWGVPVHDNFNPDSTTGIIPWPAGNLRGGHGMALGGWKRNLWRSKNSWGRNWGQDGLCWFPWTWPAWEVWGMTDAETPKPKTSRIVRIVDGDFRIWVDGEPTKVDRAPQIIDGRFMACVRHVAAGLGAEVRWDWLPMTDPENPGKVYAEFELPLIDLPIGRQRVLGKLPGTLENLVRRMLRWVR